MLFHWQYIDDIEAVLEHAIQHCKNLNDDEAVLNAIEEGAAEVCRIQGYGDFMQMKLSDDAAAQRYEYFEGLQNDR